jgi:hypothetical protein
MPLIQPKHVPETYSCRTQTPLELKANREIHEATSCGLTYLFKLNMGSNAANIRPSGNVHFSEVCFCVPDRRCRYRRQMTVTTSLLIGLLEIEAYLCVHILLFRVLSPWQYGLEAQTAPQSQAPVFDRELHIPNIMYNIMFA